MDSFRSLRSQGGQHLEVRQFVDGACHHGAATLNPCVRLEWHVVVATDANAYTQLGSETPPPENGIGGKRLDQTGRPGKSSSHCGDCPLDRISCTRMRWAAIPGGRRCRRSCIAMKKSPEGGEPEDAKACPNECHQRRRLQHAAPIRAVKRREPAAQRNQRVFSVTAQAPW